MVERTDEEIARQVQRGDTESFGLLVSRYEQKMMRYARRFLAGFADAEDAVQEIFIKAYTNIRGFDAKRKFSSWLYRIAHNEFINTLKRKKKAPLLFFDPDVLFPHPLSRELADRDINEQELRQMIDRGLNDLKSRYREVLVLYYLEEMDYKEIAEILHIPTSTVGVRLRRGKEALKKIIQHE